MFLGSTSLPTKAGVPRSAQPQGPGSWQQTKHRALSNWNLCVQLPCARLYVHRGPVLPKKIAGDLLAPVVVERGSVWRTGQPKALPYTTD
jgi:hypothetical protein